MSLTGDESSSPGSSPPILAGASNDIAPGYDGQGESSQPIRSTPPSLDGTSDVEDYDDRDNRFHGPASTWHRYTQDERALAASLDHTRANDLSIHLYNTHALKTREREAEPKFPWSSKRSWANLDQDGKRPWQPDRHWTAWPMPPAYVPRPEEVFGDLSKTQSDDEIYRKDETWTPSADLEDEIKAIMTRKAKDRYRRRRWEKHSSIQSSDGTLNSSPGRLVAAIQDDDESPKPAKPLSQPHLTPAFQADDDQTSAILEPTVRHIITKLDVLLDGMHRSREGQRQHRSLSGLRARPTSSGLQSQGAASSRSKSTQRESKRRRLEVENYDDDPVSSPAEDATDEDDDAENLKKTSRRTRDPGQPQHQPGLRDWSEVLGMASLVGWDQSIIDRAARRCASLFGEGMAFRTIPETEATHINDRRVRYVPEMLPSVELKPEANDTSSTVAYFCPYSDCNRHQQASKGFRWREHMKRKHKLSADEIEELEKEVPGSKAATKASINLEDEMSNDDDNDSGELKEEGITEANRTYGYLNAVTIPLGRGKDRSRRSSVHE